MLAAADITARIVASHRSIGQVSRRRMMPRELPPDFIEAEYATRLVAEVQQWRDAIAPLLADLGSVLVAARQDSLHAREVAGLYVVIENPAGSVRTWTDRDGATGQTLMRWSYGYIEGYDGADGEDVDVYIGPVVQPTEVYVVHQRHKGVADASEWPVYDEDKVMLGWDSADAAKAAYLAQYDDPRFFGGMSVFTLDDFKRRLRANPGRKLTHAEAPAVRTDETPEGRRVRRAIDHGRMVVRQSAVYVQTVAPRLARRVVDHQRTQLGRQLKASLGVDVPTPDRKVPTQIEHFVSQNVAKIRSLGDRTLDDIERIIGDAFTSQMPIDEVGALIAKRFSVAESYARRLAADQITKLDAQVRQARHLELGIEMFQWKTMGDGLVRDSHAVKHDKVFPYRGSRAPSFFPGEEHGCRCRAVPIVDEIRIKAGIPIGRGRQRIV